MQLLEYKYKHKQKYKYKHKKHMLNSSCYFGIGYILLKELPYISSLAIVSGDTLMIQLQMHISFLRVYIYPAVIVIVSMDTLQYILTHMLIQIGVLVHHDNGTLTFANPC